MNSVGKTADKNARGPEKHVGGSFLRSRISWEKQGGVVHDPRYILGVQNWTAAAHNRQVVNSADAPNHFWIVAKISVVVYRVVQKEL